MISRNDVLAALAVILIFAGVRIEFPDLSGNVLVIAGLRCAIAAMKPRKQEGEDSGGK